VPGLGLEEPAGGTAQAGRLGLGRVQDHLDIHAGTVTPGGDIPMGCGYFDEPSF
jgi:hypothetical protein